MNILDLQHCIAPIPGFDGSVTLLNTGAVIGPEAQAMLAALHSRHPGGIASHLDQVAERGAESFIKNTYVGYGHQSVGDNGSITFFIEGVSMLVAKAIQDWALYNGQEVSTRYVDWSLQPFVTATLSPTEHTLVEFFRDFYVRALPRLEQHLREKFPCAEGESEAVYAKAIKARAFDVLRGFLPAGARTNLAWHTNFRQANDLLAYLRHHVLTEVRATAVALESSLQQAHPSAYMSKRYTASERYRQSCMEQHYHHDPMCTEFRMVRHTMEGKHLRAYRHLLEQRPPKTELPRKVAELGQIQFEFLLDFGSYRDIQRHRAVVQQMPLLTLDHGFHPWYLTELPADLADEATDLLYQHNQLMQQWPEVQAAVRQYAIPMGYRVSNRLTGDLPALVYLVELRATRFVHPTLRRVARQMAEALMGALGNYGLILHIDDEPDRFDVKRGEHDIVLA